MPAIDDPRLFVIRRDFSGGMNNRQHGSVIGDTQATLLLNADITVPGEVRKRPGYNLIEDLSDDVGYGLYGFEPAGGTNVVCAIHGSKLETWPGTSTFTERKTDFSSGSVSAMLKVGEDGEDDVLMIKIDGNNWFRMNQSYSFQDLGNTTGGSASPPDSDVALFFRNRMWILLGNKLYYSGAFPSDYSTSFNTTSGWYLIPAGEERALVGIRDTGIICLGADEIWGINPSVTPDATDKAEKLLEFGCIAKKTAVQVADDVLFLAKDGVRGLFRTINDKLQGGPAFPLSFPIKDEVESLSWAYINKATAIFFDNKYFISVPVDSSTTNNEVWVYYPSSNAWVIVTGWNIADFAKVSVSGQEKLFGIDSTDGSVYELWTGYDDEGTAIDFDEQGRKEDLGQPLITKSGGEVKVRAESSGDYDITVQVSLDDRDWETLGTLNLSGNSPTLPVALPFDLADDNIVEGIFRLDNLGPFRQIRLRLRHNDTNGSDDIKIFERSIVTYADEYETV